jgi:tetratricopeptide (TPR) repeat protein
MSHLRVAFLVFGFSLMLVPAAGAIMGSDPGAWSAPSGDADLDAGKAAFDREDWPAVIESMSKVVARRPWDDVAHTLLGFAYRKLGRYDVSLSHYGRALELNPHNRGALEYLGEAYLELGQPDGAEQMLQRLQMACRRVAVDGSAWQSECEEWVDLKAARDAYRANNPPSADEAR